MSKVHVMFTRKASRFYVGLWEGNRIMRVKCKVVTEGPGPSETVVEIKTTDGNEEVIVSRKLVKNDFLDVGPLVHEDKTRVLLELPRESVSGKWRIWVPKSAVATG